jgi:competence protein ComEC
VRGLHALGVARLDVFAVTHGDLDHRGGALRILGSLPVAELWLPATGREDGPLQALAAYARTRGTRVRWIGAGEPDTRRGDLEIEALWPDPGRPLASRNDTSLVLRVRSDGIVSLFTADIGESVERILLAEGRALAADILKVGHHGSRRSSSRAFLAAVSPRTVVVSAPCDATRGLPNALILDRLRSLGTALGWTGRDGALSLARDPGTGRWTLRTWGRARRCRA